MDSLVPTGLAGILIFVILFVVLEERKLSTASTDSPPWAGVRKEMFKLTRASMRQLRNSSQTIADGYSQFSKHGRAFFLPDMSLHAHVLVPQEHIKWLITQPDSALSVYKARTERHAFNYLNNSIEHKATIKFVDDIVGRCLTKNLHRTQADMHDECRVSVDDMMGLEEGWHEMNLQQAMKTVADRIGSRALFGSMMCRDQGYLHNMDRYTVLMGLGMMVVGQMPWFLRPFMGAMVTIPLRFYKARALSILVPLVKASMQEYRDRDSNGTQKDDSNDFVTQAVKVTMESKANKIFHDPNLLAEQFLLLAFGALSSSALVGANVFLDILTTPPELNVYQNLREEATQAFPSESDWSDAAALENLVLTDSTIRESLRTNPMSARGLLREVIPEQGITLPDGKKVPHGTWIGAPVQAVHMDNRFYEKPEQYDPFRFARVASGSDRLDAAQTSDTFLRWGHGRSACPGRWFATQELKLLIAYVTINYDIEPLGARPETMVFGDNTFPTSSTRIRVRRRKQE